MNFGSFFANCSDFERLDLGAPWELDNIFTSIRKTWIYIFISAISYKITLSRKKVTAFFPKRCSHWDHAALKGLKVYSDRWLKVLYQGWTYKVKFFRNFSEIFPKFFRNFSGGEIFPKYFRNFSEIFPKFFRNFSGSGKISEKFQIRWKILRLSNLKSFLYM